MTGPAGRSPGDTLPGRIERLRHHLAGRRDGHRAARRLSHLSAHVWIARRHRQQAALDAEVSRLVEGWNESVAPAITALTARAGRSTAPAETPTFFARGPSTMAETRAARRRAAAAGRRAAQDAEERRGAAAARSQIVSASGDTAAQVWLAQARQNLLFAVYTRSFLRAYSRATTQHAPEPAWLLHLVEPGSLTLTQTVIADLGGGARA